MTAPVLVRAYTGAASSVLGSPSARDNNVRTLPPISSYAFADILRSADCSDFQQAIDGIAEICAKSRMSLADEYSSHLPPLGEITAATSVAVKPHLLRPGMRRPLTSVPEGSSGSSEGSRRSTRKSQLFGFRRQQEDDSKPLRRIRIGSMGRTISVGGIAAMAASNGFDHSMANDAGDSRDTSNTSPKRQPLNRKPSEAAASLQRLLVKSQTTQAG